MAVYTLVSSGELDGFLRDYDVGHAVVCQPIESGVENSNYRITTSQSTTYILTLYEHRVQEDDLPFFFGLMRHLGERGISCPRPVVARDDRSWRMLCRKPAALFTVVGGGCLSLERIGVEHCRQLGEHLATLHLAGRDWTGYRSNDLSLTGWRHLLTDLGVERLEQVQSGLGAMLEQELTFLEHAWPDNLPRGAIHGDLFPDNVFFEQGRLSGIIDFYFACTDFLTYDLTIALNAWCFEEDGRFNLEKAGALTGGYHRKRPLEDTEWQAFNLLARGACLRFALTRLSDWLADRPGLRRLKLPWEYVHKLRFHRGVDGLENYGINFL